MGRKKRRFRKWRQEMKSKGKYRSYQSEEDIRPGKLRAYYEPERVAASEN